MKRGFAGRDSLEVDFFDGSDPGVGLRVWIGRHVGSFVAVSAGERIDRYLEARLRVYAAEAPLLSAPVEEFVRIEDGDAVEVQDAAAMRSRIEPPPALDVEDEPVGTAIASETEWVRRQSDTGASDFARDRAIADEELERAQQNAKNAADQVDAAQQEVASGLTNGRYCARGRAGRPSLFPPRVLAAVLLLAGVLLFGEVWQVSTAFWQLNAVDTSNLWLELQQQPTSVWGGFAFGGGLAIFLFILLHHGLGKLTAARGTNGVLNRGLLVSGGACVAGALLVSLLTGTMRHSLAANSANLRAAQTALAADGDGEGDDAARELSNDVAGAGLGTSAFTFGAVAFLVPLSVCGLLRIPKRQWAEWHSRRDARREWDEEDRQRVRQLHEATVQLDYAKRRLAEAEQERDQALQRRSELAKRAASAEAAVRRDAGCRATRERRFVKQVVAALALDRLAFRQWALRRGRDDLVSPRPGPRQVWPTHERNQI